MSYCAVYLNRIHREKNLPEKPENPLVLEKSIPYDADFSFVDFVPSVLTYSSKAHEVEYHRFSHLVEAANNWIRKNSHWNIINCETVLLAYRHNVTSMVSRWEQLINPVTPLWSPTNRGEFETVLKALRLWIQRKELMDDVNDDQQEEESMINNEQQKQKYIRLKYLDFIPQKLHSQNSDFETIDDLLIRVNLRLKQYDTFHWNIITLESLKIESNSEWTIDPEICLAEESTKHLTILRLYYGEYITNNNKNGRMETDFNNFINNNSDMMIMVGIEDFKPKLLSAGSFFRKPELEPFATLVQRASTWLNDNQSSSLAAGHYFLNAQSINIKIKSLTKLKTKICTNTENGDYVQFLRIVYYKFLPRPQGPTVPAIQQPRPRSTEPKAAITGTNTNQCIDVLRLCSKVFIATKLDHPLDSMQQRIYHWLHTESNQNICMLSAETIDIYAKDNDERVLEKKCSECFQGNRLGTLNTYTFKAIRLYYYLVETELTNQQNRSKCYNSISYSKTFPIQKQNRFNTDKNSSGPDMIQQHHQYHNRKKQQDKEIRFDDKTIDNFYKTNSGNSNNNDNRRQIETSMGFMENLKKTQNEIRNRSKSCNCM